MMRALSTWIARGRDLTREQIVGASTSLARMMIGTLVVARAWRSHMDKSSAWRLSASRAGVWLVKHVVSPIDRRSYRWTGGRGIAIGGLLGPRLLLTTIGRRSGRPHTTPVFYLRDAERLIICNVNPGFERPNPWTLNLHAHPKARVQFGRHVGTYRARLATEDEVAQYWPGLVTLWPAYQLYVDRGGRRTIFILEPACDETVGADTEERA